MSRRPHLPLSRRAVAAAALAAAGALGVTAVAGPAWATTGSSSTGSASTGSSSAGPTAPGDLLAKGGDPNTAKAKVVARITKAIAGIDKASAALPSDAALPPADRAALTSKLASLRQQLTDARASADAAADRGTLRTAVKGVLTNVKGDGVAAQVRAAVASERLRVTIDRLTGRLPAIEAWLNGAKAKGRDITAAQAALGDIRTRLAAATAKVTGLADAVITGHTSPADASTALAAARSDLKAAKADAQVIRTALK